MKVIALLLALSLLSSCNFHGQLMRRKVETTETPSRKQEHLLIHGTYESIKNYLISTAPSPKATTHREGYATFSIDRKHYRFKYTYSFTDPENWSWIFLDPSNDSRIASLHRNSLGLTYQHVRANSFIQGDEEKVWSKLGKMSWQKNLETASKLLTHQKFDPRHNWTIEEDGLKYLIITRVDQSQEKETKVQLYLHKKRQVIGRILKSTIDENIIEDIHLSDYRYVGDVIIPTAIRIDRAWLHEKVKINARKTWFTVKDDQKGVFKKLPEY